MYIPQLILLLLISGFFGSQPILAQPEAPLLGDESDGSRAISVHRIPLMGEDGLEISPDEEPQIPFSIHQTCALKCHNYNTITRGWHFNALDAEVVPGRHGHPWIYFDVATGTRIPLSYRVWPGTYKPDEIGITPWRFVRMFGRHLPGGGIGEFDASSDPDKVMRQMVSGKLEANCLACHDANPAHDQAEYAIQIARENFRWAAAATSGFTSITGSAQQMPDTFDYLMPDEVRDPKQIPPTVEYRSDAFDSKKQVFFDIVRKIPKERCYFCHSTHHTDSERFEKWAVDEDVHLKAGLTCVDCHRHGLDHNIVRGYEGEDEHSSNPLAAASSCEGCHLGFDTDDPPVAGRMGAPIPKHRGLPLIHFQKLSCTACHSGPWPSATTHRIKTSLAHGLGTHNVDKANDALPPIQSPVLARGSNGKIAPHHAVWPAFWGVLQNEKISPLPVETITQIVTPEEKEFREQDTTTQSKENPFHQEWIARSLESLRHILAAGSSESQPVYVCGGRLYQLDDQGQLSATSHTSAQPYLWPMAHDVRPAAQSLGVRGCEDCHSLNAPFFFGKVGVDSPLQSDADATRSMIEFQQLSPTGIRALALSFKFRILFKIITLFSAGIVSLVLLVYALKGFTFLLNAIAKPSSPRE